MDKSTGVTLAINFDGFAPLTAFSDGIFLCDSEQLNKVNQVDAQLISCVPPRSAKSIFSDNRMKNKVQVGTKKGRRVLKHQQTTF